MQVQLHFEVDVALVMNDEEKERYDKSTEDEKLESIKSIEESLYDLLKDNLTGGKEDILKLNNFKLNYIDD